MSVTRGAVPATELVALSPRGRRFSATRRIRLADADPGGRLRLDALARILQDVGNDDFADAGLDVRSPWVARRTSVIAERWPQLGERVEVVTWCGGLGGRWAERRTSLSNDDGARVEVAAVWVHVGGDGRPVRLPEWFTSTYSEAAGGRTISARLRHPTPSPEAISRPWPLRASDLDVLGHVNNAATWQAVEDEIGRRLVTPLSAELEYGAAIEATDDVSFSVAPLDGSFYCWLLAEGGVRASARVML